MRKIILVALSILFSVTSLLAQDNFAIHTNINSQLSSKCVSYDDADYKTNPKAKFTATVTAPYVEKTLPEEWDAYRWLLDLDDYKAFRNNMIAKFASQAVWDTLSDASKQALIRNYIWPSAETTTNLDLLYTQAQRDAHQKIVIQRLNHKCNIRKSTTPGSRIYFDMQLDDTGILNTVEITTDQTI